MPVIHSVDPATGRTIAPVADETTSAELARIVNLAASAAPGLEALGRTGRATLLRALSGRLESRRAEIVELGMRETALPAARLDGELTRTAYQARLFADVLDEGSYLEATIDHSGGTPMGPGPDLRRMLVPLGPVAVFGASNFPLAFSVPGGDTVSALAAGNPVVVKAHSSHPGLSLLAYEALRAAAAEAGAPEGTIGLVFGTRAGAELVAHPAVRAVGFTGSLSGGRALLSIIEGRAEPIPFYGELASLNPVVITPGAAAARTAELAAGLATSVTGSGGQLCTKPGLVFVPEGKAGDALLAETARLISATPASTLLNNRIATAYTEISTAMLATGEFGVLAEGGAASADGFSATPKLFQFLAGDLNGAELNECFGPLTVAVRYEAGRLEEAISRLPGSLTATIHAQPDEQETTAALTTWLRPKAGRLLYAGFPTGVLVSWAQHHGGPWPATNSLHTSVGPTAIRRFLRPVTWQSAPDTVLPTELRDGATDIPRRVDGHLVLPGS